MNYSRALSWVLAMAGFMAPNLRAATVYTDSVHFYGSTFPGTQAISAWTQPGGAGDGAALVFDIGQSLILTSDSGTVGIGHMWYAVSPNTVIGPDMVSSGTLLGGVIGGNYFGNQLQLQEGQDFLLGFWLDSGGLVQPPLSERGDSLPGVNDRFGWVRLNYTTADGLKIVDSAISVSDPILAGTLITVPEASSLMIAGLAGGMLLRRRRNA